MQHFPFFLSISLPSTAGTVNVQVVAPEEKVNKTTYYKDDKRIYSLYAYFQTNARAFRHDLVANATIYELGSGVAS